MKFHCSFERGQERLCVTRAYLLSCFDASLSPHLHNLRVWLDGIDGVAITVVVHERIHRVDHRTVLIDLTEAHSINSLEPTIDLSRNKEMGQKMFKYF